MYKSYLYSGPFVAGAVLQASGGLGKRDNRASAQNGTTGPVSERVSKYILKEKNILYKDACSHCCACSQRDLPSYMNERLQHLHLFLYVINWLKLRN